MFPSLNTLTPAHLPNQTFLITLPLQLWPWICPVYSPINGHSFISTIQTHRAHILMVTAMMEATSAFVNQAPLGWDCKQLVHITNTTWFHYSRVKRLKKYSQQTSHSSDIRFRSTISLGGNISYITLFGNVQNCIYCGTLQVLRYLFNCVFFCNTPTRHTCLTKHSSAFSSSSYDHVFVQIILPLMAIHLCPSAIEPTC